MKYRIKSYHYTYGDHRRKLLFTLEELGECGEFRQYADEIIQHPAWQKNFSPDDAKTIQWAAASE